MMPSRNISDTGTPIALFRAQRDALLSEFDTLDAGEFLSRMAIAVDEYFLAGFAQSAVGPEMGIMKNPYVLVALGGYGRAEQCVYSDIDLLFLFEKKVPPEAEALVREIVYPLWDMGLEVATPPDPSRSA